MESHQVPTTFSQTLHNPVFRSHPGKKTFHQGEFNWEHLRHPGFHSHPGKKVQQGGVFNREFLRPFS